MRPDEPSFRKESDLLGCVRVPADALYGAQTQRALANFPTQGERTIGHYWDLIRGLLAVKQAAAQANCAVGLLDERVARAIVSSAERIVHKDRLDQFPIHFLHGGGGTSANMNANEVLANMAEEALGGTRGQYRLVHPNDHVNLNQSTNDVYPTACHIAIIRGWPPLRNALADLASTFRARASELAAQPRIARTCLQDAVDIRFGDLLGAYATLLERATRRLDGTVDALHTVNLGGTIVGRTSDVPQSYLEQIVPALRDVLDDSSYEQAQDLFDAAQNPDPIAAVSAELAILARGLIKIAQDFRLMASGPETGLREIRLPAVQPGSSAMPGKINPVIPEFLIQVSFQALGHDTACQTALDHGELELNVWESSMVFNVLDAMRRLRQGVMSFDERCVQGFTVNAQQNRENAATIIPLLTRLMHDHGYSKMSKICSEAEGDVDKLYELLQEYL